MEMGGGASVNALLREALLSKQLINISPSVTAAAILYLDRKLKGKVRSWPSSLMHLTGIDENDECFQQAVNAVSCLAYSLLNTPPDVLSIE